MIGYLKDLTHSTQTGMYVLAGMLVIGAIATAHAGQTGQSLNRVARGAPIVFVAARRSVSKELLPCLASPPI